MEQFDRDNVPAFRMPPPSPEADPAVIVNPLIETFMPALILKIRLALPPETEITLAPGPLIVTLSEMTSSPVVNVIVPVNPAWKLIVSAAGLLALALRMAWRKLPAPASFRLVTINVTAEGGAIVTL